MIPVINHPTDRQLDVLREIARSSAAKGFGPTIRDLGAALGITSTNGVNDHLKQLELKGLVAREERGSRTLRLTPAGVKWVQP